MGQVTCEHGQCEIKDSKPFRLGRVLTRHPSSLRMPGSMRAPAPDLVRRISCVIKSDILAQSCGQSEGTSFSKSSSHSSFGQLSKLGTQVL